MEITVDKGIAIPAMLASPAPRSLTVTALGIMATTALLAGWMPLQMSIATVFLFAGPHNWMEFRYFLPRMPVRWAGSRNYFLFAIAGVLSLTGLYVASPLMARHWHWGDGAWWVYTAAWNSLLTVWIVALIALRSRQVPGRNWHLCAAAGLFLLAVNWLAPQIVSVALVYLHPLLALGFLDCQLRRRRSRWLKAYRRCLACLPLLIFLLWWRLADAAPLPENSNLAVQIVQHAGTDILRGVSSHLLVAVHVLLETLHYCVWLIALPVLGLQTAPWRTSTIPLVRHRLGWPRLARAVLVLGGFLVLALWVCFLTDYSTTREVYFTVAMLHVLAEVPFLVRMV